MAGRSTRRVVESGIRCELRRNETVERLGRVGRWYLPAEARTLRWSREAARIHGCGRAASSVRLETLLAAYAPADRDRLAACLDAAMTRGWRFDFEAELRLASGPRYIRTAGETERDPDGRVAGVLVAVQDISDHRAALTALARAEERQADFLETASDWLWETGPDLRFTYVAERVELVTGVPAGFHVGKSRHELMGDMAGSAEAEAHLAMMRRREPFRDFRYWRVGHDGRRQYISASGKPVFDDDGRFLGYRGSSRDLTAEQKARDALMVANRGLARAKKRAENAVAKLRHVNELLAERHAAMARAEAEIRHAALHDPLTDLPNRRYLDLRLAELGEICRAEVNSLGVLHVGLDRFKTINDALGRETGDAVLRYVAGMLSGSLRPGDFVARVGGDEFVVLCPGRGEPTLEMMARGLIAAFDRPFIHEGRECWLGASVGIAAMRGDTKKPTELLVDAEIALHRAKDRGRGCHHVFTAELQRETVRYKEIADGVLAGLKRDEFVPFYQPQVSAATGRIVGVEALARWRHPGEGLLSPGTFLGVAEDLGVVACIDRTILELAVGDLERWRALGLSVPKLSVNVSAKRLLDRDLIGSLTRIRLPPKSIAFELLETAFLDDVNGMLAWSIDTLKEMGIEIELDDFGSGHASIVSLIKLGPKAIKLDRELVSTVTRDATRRALVRSVIEIGRSLGTSVIAEGVETADQAGLLRELGCDALQGFYFAPPMCARDFADFARSWQDEERSAVRKTG